MCGSNQSKTNLNDKKLQDIWAKDVLDPFAQTFRSKRRQASRNQGNQTPIVIAPSRYFIKEDFDRLNLPHDSILEFSPDDFPNQKGILSSQSSKNAKIYLTNSYQKMRVYYNKQPLQFGHDEVEAFSDFNLSPLEPGEATDNSLADTNLKDLHFQKMGYKKENESSNINKSVLGKTALEKISSRWSENRRGQDSNINLNGNNEASIIAEKKGEGAEATEKEGSKVNSINQTSRNWRRRQNCTFVDFEVAKSVYDENMSARAINTTELIFTPEDWVMHLTSYPDPYQDDEFPDEQASLVGYAYDFNSKKFFDDPRTKFLDVILEHGIKWSRPSYSDKMHHLIQGEIDGNAVIQGFLPDDYFIASVIALAQKPNRIKKLILQTEMNSQEVFGFVFNDMGFWTIMDVDESLPFYKRTLTKEETKQREEEFKKELRKVHKKYYFLNTEYVGASAVDNSLWVNYLEKAYAKLNNGYFNICNNGDARYALTDLTGASSDCRGLWKDFEGDKSSYWDYLSQCSGNDFVIVSQSCDSKTAAEEYKDLYSRYLGNESISSPADFMIRQLGIIPEHHYAVIDLKYFGGGKRAVVLRSTYGRCEGWLGGWAGWPEKLKERITRDEEKTGNFYMDFEDFCRVFPESVVCYYFDDYVFTDMRFKCIPNRYSCYQLQVTQPGAYYLRCSQLPHFIYSVRDTRRSISYPEMSMIIGQETPIDKTLIAAVKAKDKDLWAKAMLYPGVYRVYIKAKFKSINRAYLGLCIYGPKTVQIKKQFHDVIDDEKNIGYQINSLVSSRICRCDQEYYKPFPGGPEFEELHCLFMPKTSYGIGAMAFKNISFNKGFTVTLFDKKIIYPRTVNQQGDFEIYLDAGQTCVVSWICDADIKKDETEPLVKVKVMGSIKFESNTSSKQHLSPLGPIPGEAAFPKSNRGGQIEF